MMGGRGAIVVKTLWNRIGSKYEYIRVHVLGMRNGAGRELIDCVIHIYTCATDAAFIRLLCPSSSTSPQSVPVDPLVNYAFSASGFRASLFVAFASRPNGERERVRW